MSKQMLWYTFCTMAYSPELLQEMANAQDAFVWEAPSWDEYERGPKWMVWFIVCVIVLTIYAIFTSNYLFAFIVLLAAIILILAGNKKPHPILVQIGQNGIVYNGTFYQYDELDDFAIIYQPPQVKLLYVQPKGITHSRMRISLEDEDPVALRNHLKQYLDEDLTLHEEHVSDIVARLLKL